MAKNKQGFILYRDIIHTVEHLSDDQAGKLFKHILEYVNDKSPTLEDPILKIAFEPVKQSLKRDLKKYEAIKQKRAEAGKRSGEARRRKAEEEQQEETKGTSVHSVQQTPTKRTVRDSDSVSDSVSDILLEKETKEVFYEWLEYRKQIKKTIKSEKTLKSIAKRMMKEGATRSREVVQYSIDNQYQGLFWNRNEKPISKTENSSKIAEKMKDYE